MQALNGMPLSRREWLGRMGELDDKTVGVAPSHPSQPAVSCSAAQGGEMRRKEANR